MCCNRVIFSASFACRPVCRNPFGGNDFGSNVCGCFRDCGHHHHHHGCGCQRQQCGCNRGWC